MYHFNPLYKSGYFNVESDGIDFQLEQGEMLAACPKCMAVLAIRPSMPVQVTDVHTVKLH